MDDYIATACELFPDLCATARTALQQRDEAVKWAQHKPTCPKDILLPSTEHRCRCTCGLDAFLAAVAQKGGG